MMKLHTISSHTIVVYPRAVLSWSCADHSICGPRWPSNLLHLSEVCEVGGQVLDDQAGHESATEPTSDAAGFRGTPGRSWTDDDSPVLDYSTKIKIAVTVYLVVVTLLAIWVIRDSRNRSIENGVIW